MRELPVAASNWRCMNRAPVTGNWRAVQNRAAAAACFAAAVAFLKTSFKHRSIKIEANFTKLTLHLCFKCIIY
jgi:hypothetical protein